MKFCGVLVAVCSAVLLLRTEDALCKVRIEGIWCQANNIREADFIQKWLVRIPSPSWLGSSTSLSLCRLFLISLMPEKRKKVREGNLEGSAYKIHTCKIHWTRGEEKDDKARKETWMPHYPSIHMLHMMTHSSITSTYLLSIYLPI